MLEIGAFKIPFLCISSTLLYHRRGIKGEIGSSQKIIERREGKIVLQKRFRSHAFHARHAQLTPTAHQQRAAFFTEHPAVDQFQLQVISTLQAVYKQRGPFIHSRIFLLLSVFLFAATLLSSLNSLILSIFPLCISLFCNISESLLQRNSFLPCFC